MARKRNSSDGKSVITNNNKYRDRRSKRKGVTAKVHHAVKPVAVVKAGTKFKAAVGAAAEGTVEIAKAGHHPERLGRARHIIHEAVSAMPSKDERLEIRGSVAKHIEQGLEPTEALQKKAQGARLTREEEAKAQADAADITENLVETVTDTANTLAEKASKWDAAAAQAYSLAGALQEVITSVDAIGKAAQINGDIPEAGTTWDAGTLTFFTDDGRRISLKNLLVAGMYVRTLEFVKGAGIGFDSTAKKAFLDTSSVRMQFLDSTAPNRGLHFSPVVMSADKAAWTAFSVTWKSDALEEVRPYGFQPQSYEFQEYPLDECRYYRIRATVPYNRTTGAPVWPASGQPWIQQSANLFQPNDAGADLQGNVRLDRIYTILNFAEKDVKATHKETIAQLVDLKDLIDKGYSDIEIEVAVTRYTSMRSTPCMDSHIKELTRQAVSLLGNSSGTRDISALLGMLFTGPAWDVLAQSGNATAALTSITELFGTPKELADTKRALK